MNDLPLIDGIDETKILLYFASINAGEFPTTAELFAEDGILYPPFDSPLSGREAIVNYLEKEARGMKLIPKKGVVDLIEGKEISYKVKGQVKTSLFSVNVAWYFVLNDYSEILLVKVKLLAKFEELLHLKNFN
jgi:hypothetical protein